MKNLFTTARAVIMLLCLGFSLGAQAVDTTDHLELSYEGTLVPGGDGEFTVTVSLAGTRIYTAYNMDIHLPEGIELASDEFGYIIEEDNELWTKVSRTKYSHTFEFSYGAAGERTIRCYCISTSNTDFNAASGTLFTFCLKATPYCKPGSLDITIDGINFTALEGGSAVKYVPADETHAITVGTSSSVSVSVSAANKYSTLVLPFAAALPDGLEAYSCRSVDGDNLVLEAASSLAAYTPYILYAESGYSGTLTGTVDASAYAEVVSDGYLRGAIVKQQVNSGYVLQNQGSGVKFYNVDGQNFAIPVGRCWLDVSGSSSKAFEWGDPTAVKAVKTRNATNVYYNIDGTRAQDPQPGRIYIRNDKKILKLK